MMKTNVISLMLMGFLATTAANAAIKLPAPKNPEGQNPVLQGVAEEPSKVVDIQSNNAKMCNDGNKIPLGLLKTITPEFNSIRISMSKNKDSAKIQFPRYNTTCMDLKLKYHQVGNNVFISAVNEFKFDEKKYPQRTTNEKYEACLKDRGVINDDMVIDLSKGDYVGGFNQRFPIALDENQDMKINFASPQSLAQDYVNDATHFLEPAPMDCMVGEDLVGGGFVLFKSPMVASVEHYEEVCRGSNYQDLYNALKELESSEAGNAKALDSDVKSIVAKMLNEQLNKAVVTQSEQWDKRLEEIGKELRQTKDYEQVKALSDEYLKIINDLDKFVVQPQINETIDLYAARAKTTDKKERREMDKKLKELNESVAKYARKSKYVSNEVLNKMLDNGLKDQADQAFGFKLKVAHYAEVNYGPARQGYPKNPAKIAAAIETKQAQFEKKSEHKEKLWNAKMGYEEYSKGYMSTAKNLYTSRDLSLQRDQSRLKNQYKEITKYCRRTFWGGVKNKSRCQSAMLQYNGMQQNAYKRYNRYNQQITEYTNMANEFYDVEQQYVKSLAPTEQPGFVGYDDIDQMLGVTPAPGMGDFSFAQTPAMPGAQMMGPQGQMQYQPNPYAQMPNMNVNQGSWGPFNYSYQTAQWPGMQYPMPYGSNFGAVPGQNTMYSPAPMMPPYFTNVPTVGW